MTILIRPGTSEDLFGAFVAFQLALHGLYQSVGQASEEDKPDPEDLSPAFEYFRTFTEYFTQTAEHFWVAEEGGEIIGFSRSIVRDGIRQLSEFFVRPDKQAQGVGKRLLEAAFSSDEAHNRVVIGTSDIRALTRYLKSGVKFRFTIYDWSREPEIVPFESDLSIEPFTPTPENVAILNSIDQIILGYTRDVDHIWLSKNRHGHFYRRNGQVVGYSYVSHRAGPIAMLHNNDFHPALAHVESEMTKYVDDVWKNIYLPVPMTNTAAVDYVLKRGFQTSPLLEHFMSDKRLGAYENYIFMDPPFIT
ncbi:MAG TPA: GNAT family N-acetyltransferase [Anaerolineales bacterium]|nr:GNAT family N-acetyltransferase [Anaerolineales bacterium]